MKLWVKLEGDDGWQEHMFEIPEGRIVKSITVSSIHGPLMIFPFQLEGDLYLRTRPPRLAWREMPDD
jgi:hypothetical protein